MKGQQEFFSDLREAERRQQFRMRRLQVYNWGTFSDLHDIRIAEQGFLFVGRSGSGKSTLLDAITALLVPPQWQLFNAAAREGDRSRRDRNLVTYVRGAWGEQKDGDSGEIASQFLRRGTTWSALALSFSNDDGKHLSLIQLYWLRGGATAPTEVKRHYMIAQRPFDIASELQDFDLDVRALKHRLDDVEHFGNTFRPYGERFRQLMAIDSETAMKLLHKTQSAKNLGDLNDFLREFMLDAPRSFEAAERLVAEFTELDAAHQSVVTARRQVEALKPAREAHQNLEEIRSEILDHELQLAGMEGYCRGLRRELLAKEIAALVVREEGLTGEEGQRHSALENVRAALAALLEEHRSQGGGRVEELTQRLREAERQRDDRLRKQGQMSQACQALGWSTPDNPSRFSEVLGEARASLEAWRDDEGSHQARRDALRDQYKSAEREFDEVRREIAAMERQPSNIPAHMLELRQTTAAALGIADAELPFVGELLQVKTDEAPWRGAIERVLHGFALSLLVDESRYAAVAKYVDETHLGNRLVYYRVGRQAAQATLQPGAQSLVHKLEVKRTVHEAWLTAELERRFDYACVDNLSDFRREKRALTRQGQVRHGADRHEKDDRRRIDDRRYWVLGFDNREKLALYRRRAQEVGAALAEHSEELRALDAEQRTRQARMQACMTLVNLLWQDVDVAGTLDLIQQLDAQIRRLEEGSSRLRELGELIERERQREKAADKALGDVRVSLQRTREDLARHRQEHESLTATLADHPQPEPRHRDLLETRFRSRGDLSLANLDTRRREVESAIRAMLMDLTASANRQERRIENAFADFKREWPAAAADFDATLASAPDYFALLGRLEWDGLPQHEKRFFDLLKQQSSENLAALNTHLSQARKEIGLRLEQVNEGLADAEFNPGTHLQIDLSDRYLPEVKDFRDRITEVIRHAWQGDPERAEAEQRFLAMRELVARLGGEEAEHRRWRELVLDVRLHVDFIGKELDREGRVLEVYRSGAGKSGGQREKLSTTCLAAALRYQLGGSDGGLPVYAPVVLDEAFGKADNEFTELAMRIFENFGFQMIVATPLKAVMTLEPFIGGACFVEISDRRHSATLPIDYDTERQRLNLPHDAHGEELFT